MPITSVFQGRLRRMRSSPSYQPTRIGCCPRPKRSTRAGSWRASTMKARRRFPYLSAASLSAISVSRRGGRSCQTSSNTGTGAFSSASRAARVVSTGSSTGFIACSVNRVSQGVPESSSGLSYRIGGEIARSKSSRRPLNSSSATKKTLSVKTGQGQKAHMRLEEPLSRPRSIAPGPPCPRQQGRGPAYRDQASPPLRGVQREKGAACRFAARRWLLLPGPPAPLFACRLPLCRLLLAACCSPLVAQSSPLVFASRATRPYTYGYLAIAP